MLRSLNAIGIEPVMLINHSERPLIELTKFKCDIDFYNTVDEIPDILMSRYAGNSSRPIVICCDDNIQSSTDNDYNRLSQHFILSDINQSQGEITRHMNKEIQMDIANKAGMTVPASWLFHKGEKITDDVIYPCFAKTSISLRGSKADMRVCNNREELQRAVNTMDYLVQEYIDKDYEVIIWGTSIGEKKYYMTGVTRKIRHIPLVTGMSSFGVVERFEDHPNLDKDALSRFLNLLNYHGMFSIEMAVKGDKYYFLEINLRNDGKQHFSTAAGANLPKMYVLSRLSKSIDIPNVVTPTYYMGELADYHHVGMRNISFTTWFKDLMHTNVFFILNKKDLRPFIAELKRTIKLSFQHKFKRSHS